MITHDHLWQFCTSSEPNSTSWRSASPEEEWDTVKSSQNQWRRFLLERSSNLLDLEAKRLGAMADSKGAIAMDTLSVRFLYEHPLGPVCCVWTLFATAISRWLVNSRHAAMGSHVCIPPLQQVLSVSSSSWSKTTWVLTSRNLRCTLREIHSVPKGFIVKLPILWDLLDSTWLYLYRFVWAKLVVPLH